MRRCESFACIVVIACTSQALGDISAFWAAVASGDGSVGAHYPPEALLDDPALLKMQTWDLRVVTDGNWSSAGLHAALSNDAFYNHPLRGSTRPNFVFYSIFPAIQFDTYITAPGDFGAAPAPTIFGGFPPGQPLSMSGSVFSVEWGDLVNDPPGLYQIARLTYPLRSKIQIHPETYASQTTPDSTVTAPRFGYAAHDQWLRDADGSWHDGTNWTLGRPPNDGDSVTIDVGGPIVRTITYSQGSTTLDRLNSLEHLLLAGGRLHVAVMPLMAGNVLSVANGLTISGGTLRARVEGSPVTIAPAGGTLELCDIRDGLIVAADAQLNIRYGLTLSSVGSFGSGALVRFEGLGSSLHGSGTMYFDAGGVVQVRGGSTLRIEQTTIRGQGLVLGAQTPATVGTVGILNYGRVVADGGRLTVASGTLHSAGTLLADAGAELHVESRLTNAGRIGGDGAVRALNGLIAQGTTTKVGSGPLRVNGEISYQFFTRVDLTAGSIVNDYDGASPLAGTRAKIITGYNNGSWTGLGINSSAAAEDPSLGIGYAEASALFTSFPAMFEGESIDNTTMLLRLVRFGDANLDGTVNLADFNRLAANFGSTSALWSDGDFNYDGITNLADFNRLAGNFGLSASRDGPTPQDWAALPAAVPEPGGFVRVPVFLAALVGRRRRGARSSRMGNR